VDTEEKPLRGIVRKAAREHSRGGRMKLWRGWNSAAVSLLAICGLVWLGAVARTPGAEVKGIKLGGAHGVVRSSTGGPIEGMGVQLISKKTAIRTTVYSNDKGDYEFPVLDAGEYTLRIALPREYKPYVKEPVQIEGATKLDDIVLERISQSEFVPATTETLAQLTGQEWMMNLPGTGEEKRVFSFTCGFGCHSYQQIFRNRYDEPSWRVMIQRMTRGAGSPLINMAKPTPAMLDRADRPVLEDELLLTKWLSRVRGPDSQDPPLYFLPRPKGESTKVIITEYELPRELLAPHDVFGDANGNIWYTAHRSPFQGRLDPRTGVVKEFRVPEASQATPGGLPGTHHVMVDKNGIVWFSENWTHYLDSLDPKTGKILSRVHPPGPENQLNSPGFGNFGMDAAGDVFDMRGGEGGGVAVFEGSTGKLEKMYPTTKIKGTYDNLVSPDGRYWSGAPIGTHLIGVLDTKTGKLSELETDDVSSGSRGAFDAEGNAWYGGRGGMLIRVNPKTLHIDEFYAPNQYDTFYEAMPDKNGEIWAGGLQSGRFMRFNPKTGKWTQYMMPEPYAHDRRTWIDNSTNPVTIWYVDHEGFMVRIQPLE
jgi:streptogramin lyase